ncbi:MAG TPA: gluconate 2-dehydrogenase subunit 3 family protein [Gemmatimonadales bacterium]|nr:gluconate 2-dehydrogenase subunit 3 family protein [Gemmatimonadales bacterium]
MSIHRRGFLQAGALGGLILAGCERPAEEGATATPTESLSGAERADLEAVASRILPSDDGTPGAKEANVIGFLERGFTTYHAFRLPIVRTGLADLTRRAGGSFAALPASRQDALLKAVEQTEFFQLVRAFTLCGMFADPSWGGNREQAGWRLLGFDPRAIWQPPFGFYDADPGEDA